MLQVGQSKYALDQAGGKRAFQQEVNGFDACLQTAGAFRVCSGSDDLHILPVLDRGMRDG